MKKLPGLILSFVLLLAVFALPVPSPAEGAAANPTIKVNLNGIAVKETSAISEAGGRVYLSVPYFTSFYEISYQWDDKTKALTVDSKAITAAYGKPVLIKGVLHAPLRALVEGYGGSRAQIGYDAASKTTNAVILPPNVVRMTTAEAKIGERWASPIQAVEGLVYGVHNGKLLFVEYTVEGKASTAKKLSELPAISVPVPATVNHTKIEWFPAGHNGNAAPHSEVRLLFVSPEESNKIPAAADTKTLVTLGDSIVFGYNLLPDSGLVAPNAFPSIAGNAIKHQTVNLGVSGLTSEGLLENLKADSIRRSLAQADIVMVNIGSNDIMGLARELNVLTASNLSPVITPEMEKQFDAASDKFKANFAKIIDTLRRTAPDARIVMSNLYNPVPDLYVDLFKVSEPLVLKQNAIIAQMAKEKNVQVFDAYTVINGKQRDLMFRMDVHPNAKGHDALGKALADTLLKPWKP